MNRPSRKWGTPHPRPGASPPLMLPTVQKDLLPNGLNVWLVQRPGLPLVSLHLVAYAGADYDGSGLTGLATMTAEALDAGTPASDALQIARRVEFLGAAFQSRATIDGTFISLVSLSRHLGAGLDIFAELLAAPTFPQPEFERRTAQRRAALLQLNDQPNVIASLAFNRIVYGSQHPYGNNPAGTEESILGMTRERVAEFCAAYYRPNNGTLVAVGDMSLGDLSGMLARKLASWTPNEVSRRSVPEPPPGRPRRIHLINKPGAPQSEIRIGCPALSRTSPEVFAATVMNRILGGQFSSRLNANLRERRGLTYGAFSAFQLFRGRGPFVASAAVASDKTALAVREFLVELDRMREHGVHPAELGKSQQGLTGSLPLILETPAQIAAALQMIPLYGLPEDYYSTYTKNIQAVTLADIRMVGERFLDTSAMTIVVVGNVPEIRKEVEKLNIGEVVLCDTRGDELSNGGS